MSIYNNFYTEEKWDNVCQYNKDLMEDYLLEARAQKKAKGTIRIYRNNLRIVLIYILEELNNQEIYKLKKRDFRNMVLYFQDKNMSSGRINNIKSSLNSMLDYAEDSEDYEDINANYASKLKCLTKDPVRDIVFLTDEEVKLIYDTLIKIKDYRGALLCALAYDSAGRKNELVQLKRNDISEDRAITETTVISKRNKKFKLMYNIRTIEAYKLYESTRIDNLDSLFVNSNGNPANEDNVYRWIKSWRFILEDKGIYKDFNVHSFRHSALENYHNGTHYVAKSLNRKFTLQELQLLAHHDSVSTTENYLKDNSEEQLIEAFTLIK